VVKLLQEHSDGSSKLLVVAGDSPSGDPVLVLPLWQAALVVKEQICQDLGVELNQARKELTQLGEKLAMAAEKEVRNRWNGGISPSSNGSHKVE